MPSCPQPPSPARAPRRAAWTALALVAWAGPSLAEGPPAAGPPPVERCGHAPAAGSRCAEALAALAGLAPGAVLDGVELAEIAVAGDRVVITMKAGGQEVVGVEVVRLDPADPPPPASAGALGLYLRSDAPGAPTPAWQLRAVLALADALGRAPAAPPGWLGRLGAATRGR